MQVNDYIEIYDNTGTILLAGRIKVITENPLGYSLDGILFINPNSDKIVIKKVNYTNNIYNNIDNNKYIIIKGNNIDNTFDYDFFMWNEIEPEVKEIVKLLNEIPGIETYSSCSGHGIIPPWVDFYIHNIDSFFNLLDFLRENNKPSKTTKHNDIESKHRFVIGVEGRGTCHLESLEINSEFKELCIVLKKYIKYRV